MTVRQPRYNREEIAQRGAEIYDRDIRPHVEAGNEGKIVAIDVESGAYELGESIVTTSDRLLARCPDAQIWFVRVGHPAVYRIGRQLPSTRRIEIDFANTDPLVGMALLDGYALYVEVRAGADVRISALP